MFIQPVVKCKHRVTSTQTTESGDMILSVTLRSLYALVSHLCLTGLPEVAMPYLDMWQESIFVREAEGVRNQSRVEALYEH